MINIKPTSALSLAMSFLLVIGSATAVGLAQDDYVPPQKLDGSRASEKSTSAGESETPLTLGSNDSGPTSGSLFEQLLTEIDNLTPGLLSEKPERKILIENAIKAFQNRNPNKSVEIFKQIQKLDKEFPPTELLLAAMSYVVKDQKAGKALLERAANTNPKNLGVYSAFSRLAINEGRVTDARVHLEKMERLLAEQELSVLAKDFYSAQHLDGMIDVAMRQQRYKDARALLKKQIAKLPNNPKVLMIAAELEFRDDKIQESFGYLYKLKEKLPTSRQPESIMATWYQRTGNKEESAKWVVKSAEKYQKDERVQLEYASWLINQGKFPQATEAIKKAEAANKETPFSKNLKAKIAFGQESYVVAEYHYEQMALARPSNFDASNMHALSLIESKDEAKRNKALDIAIKNYQSLPNNLVAQASLGYIQLRLGNLDQAKVSLARGAQSQRGASPEIDFFVASVLEAMKEKDKARGILEIALKHEGFFLYRGVAEKKLKALGGPLSPEELAKARSGVRSGSAGNSKAAPAQGSGNLPAPSKKQ